MGEERKKQLEEATRLGDDGLSKYEEGDYDEALSLLERALAIRERVLGHDHPYVAATLQYLALIHYVQGDYIEALRLSVRLTSMVETALGRDDPKTMQCEEVLQRCLSGIRHTMPWLRVPGDTLHIPDRKEIDKFLKEWDR